MLMSLVSELSNTAVFFSPFAGEGGKEERRWRDKEGAW
jgi:hypothetical protein